MTGRHTREEGAERRLRGLLGTLLSAGLVLTILILFRGSEPDASPTTTSDATAATTAATTPATTAPTTLATIGATTTTSRSTTTSIAASSTLGDPLTTLDLQPTGVGDIGFGADSEDAVAQISAVLGAPTEDTGWSPGFETCPGTEVRVVRWTSFQAFFTNGATEWAPEGTRHFFHYGQSIRAGGGELIELRTSNGIGIGSTITELRAAYGDQVTIEDDPVFGPFWQVGNVGAGILWGTAGSIADNAMIDSINGGSGCGE
ncbi:MAG: hypothetical protein ACRDWH_09470 [Acidimicrobiia bacterium]